MRLPCALCGRRVLGSGLRLAAAGVAAALLAAIGGTRVLTAAPLRRQLDGPRDARRCDVTLLGAAAAASWLPRGEPRR